MTERTSFEIVRAGRWKREGGAGYVWIIRQDWDYYHEDFYRDGPDLNGEGHAYYVLYGDGPDVGQHNSRSPTCLSESDAVLRAESALRQVEWL